MFTGIIESVGEVAEIRAEGTNLTFVMRSGLAGRAWRAS